MTVELRALVLVLGFVALGAAAYAVSVYLERRPRSWDRELRKLIREERRRGR